MGRVSRDARLTFIQLWTLADDSGRLRGNSRMLASLLFPYDDDAKDLIDGWLDELEREGCIHRYRVCGDSYIEIANWLNHQKIDKPSGSKIPSFEESSQILANPRESSSLDQGSKDQGKEQTPQPPLGADPIDIEDDKAPGALTFKAWIKALKAKNEKAIPADDPVFRYCDEVGIPHEFLAYHWHEFKTRYLQVSKRQRDWRAHFRNSVRGNWMHVWSMPNGSEVRLTTVGEQARRAIEALEHREAA